MRSMARNAPLWVLAHLCLPTPGEHPLGMRKYDPRLPHREEIILLLEFFHLIHCNSQRTTHVQPFPHQILSKPLFSDLGLLDMRYNYSAKCLLKYLYSSHTLPRYFQTCPRCSFSHTPLALKIPPQHIYHFCINKICLHFSFLSCSPCTMKFFPRFWNP